jgi:hypothetical protein
MNRLLFALSAGAALLSVAPANARQPIVAGSKVGVDARIAHLETRFHDGIASGRINRSEARMLRPRIVDLADREMLAKSDGFTWQEQRDLRHRINLVRDELQRADGRSGYAMWNDGGRFGFSGR